MGPSVLAAQKGKPKIILHRYQGEFACFMTSRQKQYNLPG
jgi:hypothetical protein